MEQIRHVLLIEDNEDDIHFIRKALSDGSYQVRIISNGTEAFQYLLAPIEMPDLVLIDYHLPGMDGLEIMQGLSKRGKEYPFVFLTIENTLDLVVQSMQAGAIDYLVKSGRIVQEIPAKIKQAEQLIAIKRDKLKVEELLRQSLEEKQTLLREIHHRVKNNLQIISSLLSIDITRYHDARDQAYAHDFLMRIQSISLVHDELYTSSSLSCIQLSKYIRRLVHQYALLETKAISKPRYHFEIDDCVVSILLAVPLGLIINELISNAAKHAFPGQEEGLVSIQLHPRGKEWELIFKDNGIGIPGETWQEEQKSLGLSLIQLLSEQLHARSRWSIDKGTSFQLLFSRDQ